MRFFTCGVGVLAVLALAAAGLCAAPPASPRIDYVDMLPEQPQQKDAATIWYDDFDASNPKDAYYEYDDNNGDCVPVDSEKYGSRGRSLRAKFQKGEQGAGGVKVFFGDNPAATGGNASLLRRPGEKFREVYWRFYLKHQRGWQGSPAKLSRATVMAGSNWSQAMIAHHWSEGLFLTLDPASGIKDNKLVTTKYNDFDNLHWLGNKPVGTYPIFATEESGHWVCVECYAKLNTPGQKDGEFTAWIDAKEDATRKGLDWLGTWNEHGLNALFLENYWNSGSAKEQERYFDNFVIATKPIGPVVVPLEPTIVKTAFSDPDAGDKQSAWQVQVAADSEGKTVAWDSGTIAGEGNSTAAKGLKPDTLYWTRVRQQDSAGTWSEWSPWLAPFRTGAK